MLPFDCWLGWSYFLMTVSTPTTEGLRNLLDFSAVICVLPTQFEGELPHNHILLDSALNIGPLIACWELDKFKNCWNKSFRTSKILTLLYQQFSNLLISQYMSGPRLGALSNNRWSGGTHKWKEKTNGKSNGSLSKINWWFLILKKWRAETPQQLV